MRKKKTRKEKLNMVEVSPDDIPEKSKGYTTSKRFSIIDTLDEFLGSGFKYVRVDIPTGVRIGIICSSMRNTINRNSRFEYISVLVRCGDLYLVREVKQKGDY